MGLHDRVKFMRMFKGWSQEDMAEKLEMAVSGYAKIEQGRTDVNFSRLQQIATVFGIELSNLIGLSEKNVFNVIENSNKYNSSSHTSVYPSESPDCQHELEKLRLINEQQANEIAYLKEIIHLLKKE
ncbi:MAG: XRE family transcriptional regulator [Candidatus Parabeggiatoa sp. nov. 1]|nr:MAG: XRE family transcriptional regulator [Gammaproteobacteria bacterium]